MNAEAALQPQMNPSSLEEKARQARQRILRMVYCADSGHIGGSLSSVEIVVALYYQLMRHDPRNPRWPERDRFICPRATHAGDLRGARGLRLFSARRSRSASVGPVLPARTSYQPKTPGTRLPPAPQARHFDCNGHGAWAKLRGQRHWYYVLCGDGEMQEGQVWKRPCSPTNTASTISSRSWIGTASKRTETLKR
jgi:transketolase